MLRNAQQSDGAGHIVVSALRQGRGIVMGGKGNVLVNLSRHVQNNIVGLAGVLFLLQSNLRPGHALANQLDGILGVDVHAGNPAAVVDMGPQLPLVDIPIRVIGIAVVGHEAHRAVFQQILIEPVAQIPVNHHDFSPAKAQGVSIGVPQIAERCFHLSASGAQVSLTGHLHAVRL